MYILIEISDTCLHNEIDGIFNYQLCDLAGRLVKDEIKVILKPMVSLSAIYNQDKTNFGEETVGRV